MKLFLLRHAEAENTHPDFERILTAKGEETIKRLAAALNKRELSSLTAIWHSPLTRAVQTAELLQSELKLATPLQVQDGLTPDDNPMKLCPKLNELDADLMIVGHNPFLTMLVNYLLVGEAWAQLIGMNKAALVTLQRVGMPSHEMPVGKWKISNFLPPQALNKE